MCTYVFIFMRVHEYGMHVEARGQLLVSDLSFLFFSFFCLFEIMTLTGLELTI